MTDLGLLQRGDVWVLPVLHSRLEYAALARRAVRQLRPAAVAVELPDTLEAAVRAAVARLPQVSVLLYEDAAGHSVYLPIEPVDPLVEALRTAEEEGIAGHLVDLDVDYPLRHAEPFPDAYAVHRIGATAYYEEYARAAARSEGAADELDRRRERGIAHRVQRLARRHGQVLLVCGMAHAARVLDDLAEPQAAPLARARRDGVALLNLHPESLPEVLTTFPLLSAVYERRRGPLPAEPGEDRLRAPRLGARVEHLAVLDGGRVGLRPSVPEDPRAGLDAAVDWIARRCPRDGDAPLDRPRAHLAMLRRAAARYRQRTGDAVQPWQLRVLQRFSRNYALLEGRLLPDLYQLLVAARGAVDENYCYELWELGEHYPWQRQTAELATVRVTAEQLQLGTRRISLRRRIPREKRRLVGLPLRRRKRERRPGEWLEASDPSGLCSYPPEDVVVEDYGDYLRKKGVQIVGEERSRVEPFTTSLLDGIDVRETVRNWHEGRIYVREQRRVPGGVGSVVIIFDPDRDGTRYPFAMSWLGEHAGESDMAFYSTPLLDHIVGPGISRCEYGGMLLSHPPLRLADPFDDPDYRFARDRTEVLLMAGIDYALDPHVVYVAAEPPRSRLRTFAERRGRKIVYVPLGQLSPASLKRIRVFHVLWGKDKREIAKDFIW